jgi:hypothetical protein
VSAKADAEADHQAREGAKLLPSSRGAQKARAMRLYGAAIEKLGNDGMASDLLNQINGADIAADAAERFDRSVNAGKYRPQLRFLRVLGLSRS